MCSITMPAKNPGLRQLVPVLVILFSCRLGHWLQSTLPSTATVWRRDQTGRGGSGSCFRARVLSLFPSLILSDLQPNEEGCRRKIQERPGAPNQRPSVYLLACNDCLLTSLQTRTLRILHQEEFH